MAVKKRGLGARLRELFGLGTASADFFEEIEEALIEADIGPRLAGELVEALRAAVKRARPESKEALVAALRAIIAPKMIVSPLVLDRDRLTCILVLGVNGVGKTTTIAKMAHYFRQHAAIEGIVLAAGDTFRAAAVEQLTLHGRRLGLRTVSQAQGADAGAVLYDAITSARARSERVVLADTAGRMHNRADLVGELMKIDRVVRNRIADGRYLKLLVVDSTTGRNGVRQAETFHEAVGIDGVIVTKADSTARAGMALSICNDLHLPMVFMGNGERYEDLAEFSVDAYLDMLLADRE